MIRRGDVVLCALPGDYWKSRPAVVAQSDLFNATHASVVVCPLTTHLIGSPLFRLSVSPSENNGLAAQSQVMVDKLTAIRTERIRDTIGRLETGYIANLDEALRLWLALDQSNL